MRGEENQQLCGLASYLLIIHLVNSLNRQAVCTACMPWWGACIQRVESHESLLAPVSIAVK